MLCFFQPYLVYMSKYFCCYILSRYLKTPTWTAWIWWKRTTWEQLRSRAYPLASTGSLMWVLSQMQRLKDWRHFRFLYVWFLLLKCLPEYLWSGVRVQRSSSNGQILLGEEQRFFGQGLEKRRRFFFSIFFRLSSVFTKGRMRLHTSRGWISCSQLKPKTTLN